MILILTNFYKCVLWQLHMVTFLYAWKEFLFSNCWKQYSNCICPLDQTCQFCYSFFILLLVFYLYLYWVLSAWSINYLERYTKFSYDGGVVNLSWLHVYFLFPYQLPFKLLSTQVIQKRTSKAQNPEHSHLGSISGMALCLVTASFEIYTCRWDVKAHIGSRWWNWAIQVF